MDTPSRDEMLQFLKDGRHLRHKSGSVIAKGTTTSGTYLVNGDRIICDLIIGGVAVSETHVIMKLTADSLELADTYGNKKLFRRVER